MSETAAERRLAAILALDVVGYSSLIQQDEAGTIAQLRQLREQVIDPTIREFKGRIFKTTGDGVLAEFNSVVNAVTCALKIQKQASNRALDRENGYHLELRIGLNLGDVVIEGEDVLGDGVNVAARLESIAPPGGIAISETVRDHLGSRLELSYEDLGLRELKNLATPIRVFTILSKADSKAAYPQLKLPDRPSIAVLPFQNMSGDQEQEYFADGIVEDIITALSRFNAPFVIARNSSFTYKGRAVDVKQVGRDLGVRYVLEGSVRKAGNRLRLTGQLIDSATGAHIWAERFEGVLEDVFALQDQITSSVVGSIAPKIELAEIERTRLAPTANQDAYDRYLRGMMGFHDWSSKGSFEALNHFRQALMIDPSYAAAYGMVARIYVQRNAGGWLTNRAVELDEARQVARKAVELGPNDAVALAAAGLAFCDLLGEIESGDALIDRALSLNPNFAWAWLNSSWTKTSLGEPMLALERIAKAERLSPNDPHISSFHAAKAYAHFCAGHFAEAYQAALSAIRQRSGFLLYECIAAGSAVLAGNITHAQGIVGRITQSHSTVRLSNLSTLIPFQRALDSERWLDAMRKAGLPE